MENVCPYEFYHELRTEIKCYRINLMKYIDIQRERDHFYQIFTHSSHTDWYMHLTILVFWFYV